MKSVEIFWITSAYLQVTLSDPKVLKKPEEKSAMGPILRVLCHDYCQSQSLRFQSMKYERIFDWQWTWDIVFPCPAEMQTKIWQKRIQNSRIGKTMWTLWGGPEEADLAKTASSSPVACIWQTRVKGATGHWAICVRGSILNKSH